MSDHGLLADLPAPRNDEPPSLRADIADELADHLRCALRRELFKDGDESAAQRRVLDRFGDPKKLARRLWWQAMWSLIMRQRILSGVQWLVSLTAVVLAGAVFWQQSQMWQEMRTARQEEAVQRQALTTALNQLQAAYGSPALAAQEVPVRPADERPPSLTEPFGEPPDDTRIELPPIRATGHDESPPTLTQALDEDLSNADPPPLPQASDGPVAGLPPLHAPGDDASRSLLKVRFVLERADGPAIVPMSVELVGNGMLFIPGENVQAVPTSVHGTRTDVPPPAGDQVVYGWLQPGRYELKVTLADGQNATRQVLIRDEKPQELTIICPPPRPIATVLVTMPPLPKDLRDAATQWSYCIAERPVLLDGVAWLPPSINPRTLSFDPKTGKAISLSEPDKDTDLRNAKPEDCVVFLPEGPAGTGFVLSLRRRRGNTDDAHVDAVVYPSASSPSDDVEDFLPRTVGPGENRWTIELPEELLAQARGALEQSRTYSNPNAEPIVDGADDAPPKSTTPPQLVLKLVQDNEDGPSADVNSVLIESRKTRETAVEQGTPYRRRFVFATLPPDHYHLTVQLNNGQECIRPLLIRDEQPQELTLICPGLRKEVPVSITLSPLPEELRKRLLRFTVKIVPGPLEIGQTRWTSPNFPRQIVTFDLATGLPTAIKMTQEEAQRNFDLSELPADERSVFLPVGTVNYWFSAPGVPDERGTFAVNDWPTKGAVGLKQTISADQKTWKLEIPPEYLDEMLGRGQAAPKAVPSSRHDEP